MPFQTCLRFESKNDGMGNKLESVVWFLHGKAFRVETKPRIAHGKLFHEDYFGKLEISCWMPEK